MDQVASRPGWLSNPTNQSRAWGSMDCGIPTRAPGAAAWYSRGIVVTSDNPLLRLHTLPELPLRRSRLRELLLTAPEGLAHWLGDVLLRAHRGDGEAAMTLAGWGSLMAQDDREVREVMPSFLASLAMDTEDDASSERTVAGDEQLVARFLDALAGPSEHRSLSKRVRLDGGGWLRGQHQVPADGWVVYKSESVATKPSPVDDSLRLITGTLHRRPRHHWVQLAYGHDDPRFRARLLDAPWLVERDVVLMAALRPCTEAMLLTIARSDRWFFRRAVREALCNNPHTPSWLVASLLPGASGATCRQLSRHRDPRLAALARDWTTGRRSVPPPARVG